MSDEAILRADLEEQWSINHYEHCSGEWPHSEGRDCHWPLPVSLGGPRDVYRTYDDASLPPRVVPIASAPVCPTCHQPIVKEAHGGEHPSAGDHDPAFHVAATHLHARGDPMSPDNGVG